ncbi:beta-hexosaminidase subunit beta-like [Haemaphysalis longicornis]
MAARPGEIPAYRQPWPKPSLIRTSREYWLLRPENFTIAAEPSLLQPRRRCPLVDAAAMRYLAALSRSECLRATEKEMTQYEKEAAGHMSRLALVLLGPCEDFPEAVMDEHYTLRISGNPKKSVIIANSAWGLLRGLETFSQLVYGVRKNLFAVNSTYIRDYPRFSHRSLRIDTSHHFISITAIKRTLDAMVMNKMNVLQWKMVGDDSFPLRLPNLLELSSQGAFRLGSHEYNAADIAEIVEYGRSRGIRILPELQSPGSLASLRRSHPELLCGESGLLDPTRRDSMDLLLVLYAELARLFPEQLVHMGGRNFSTSCWSIDEHLKKRAEEKKASVKAFINNFFESLFEIPLRLRKAAVVDDEIIRRWNITVPRLVLVDVPSSQVADRMGSVTGAGHRALVFCDGLQSRNWIRLHSCDPHGFDGTQIQKRRVLGGGTGATDHYTDNTNIIPNTWPWASAVAEALWSPRTNEDLRDTERRLAQMRCLMLKRSFPAAPVAPGYCPCDVRY